LNRRLIAGAFILLYALTGGILLLLIPTSVTVYPSMDSYSWESVPLANNGGSNNFEITSYDRPPKNMRGWIAFTLPDIPGDAMFLNAKLRLRIWHKTVNDPAQGTSDPTGRVYAVYRVTSPWTEYNVSWANQPEYTEEHEAESAVPSGQGGWDGPLLWMDWDITGIFKDWKAGAPNYGLLIRDTRENASTLYSTQFFTHDRVPNEGYYPRLIVTYATPMWFGIGVSILIAETALAVWFWRRKGSHAK